MKKGIYRHYKGGLYEVFGTVTHTETSEVMVLYTDVNNKKFVRPLSMWNEKVNSVPRFEYCNEQAYYRREFVLRKNYKLKMDGVEQVEN